MILLINEWITYSRKALLFTVPSKYTTHSRRNPINSCLSYILYLHSWQSWTHSSSSTSSSSRPLTLSAGVASSLLESSLHPLYGMFNLQNDIFTLIYAFFTHFFKTKVAFNPGHMNCFWGGKVVTFPDDFWCLSLCWNLSQTLYNFLIFIYFFQTILCVPDRHSVQTSWHTVLGVWVSLLPFMFFACKERRLGSALMLVNVFCLILKGNKELF